MPESSSSLQTISYAVLRVLLGLLFIVPGVGKLLNPSMPIGMLTSLGFPVPVFFAWLLLLSELVFGLCVLLGWKVKYTVWPLVIVLAVALFTVTIPSAADGNWVSVIFHLISLVSLVYVSANGPGKWAVA